MITITTMIIRNIPPPIAAIITTGLSSPFVCFAKILVVAPWLSLVSLTSDSVALTGSVVAASVVGVVGGGVVVGSAETTEVQVQVKIREFLYKAQCHF